MAMVAFVLVLAGCGGSGVSSEAGAEDWLRDEFTSDVMEISNASCEKAPRDSYLCSVRAVTRFGAVTSTGYLDCESKCVWRPDED